MIAASRKNIHLLTYPVTWRVDAEPIFRPLRETSYHLIEVVV